VALDIRLLIQDTGEFSIRYTQGQGGYTQQYKTGRDLHRREDFKLRFPSRIVLDMQCDNPTHVYTN